jgi:YHS domain-containing protein
MRGLLLVGAILLAVVLLWPLLRGLPRGLPPAGGTRRNELVKDPVCQTYVVLARAVRRQVDGATVYFCSAECAERHARRERPA